jgi:hypothetical protein
MGSKKGERTFDETSAVCKCLKELAPQAGLEPATRWFQGVRSVRRVAQSSFSLNRPRKTTTYRKQCRSDWALLIKEIYQTDPLVCRSDTTGRATVRLLNLNVKHRLQLRSELLAQGQLQP